MATSETQELALLLDEHRPDWDGAGFPRWVRVRVATHVVGERSARMSLAALSAGLGVSAPTLRRWTHAHSDADWGAQQGGFSRVVVDDGVPASCPTDAGAGATLRLTTPGGFVLEGLTFDQSIAALAALR